MILITIISSISIHIMDSVTVLFIISSISMTTGTSNIYYYYHYYYFLFYYYIPSDAPRHGVSAWSPRSVPAKRVLSAYVYIYIYIYAYTCLYISTGTKSSSCQQF